MAEGKITIPPPIGLLETDSYSAKANRVTSATSVMPRTVNGTGHTGPSEFCATSI